MEPLDMGECIGYWYPRNWIEVLTCFWVRRLDSILVFNTTGLGMVFARMSTKYCWHGNEIIIEQYIKP